MVSGPLRPAAYTEPALKQLRANGVELAYVDHGSGDPVVFIHGACGDCRTFDVLRSEIAARHRYIAYSRRYHQPNPWPGNGSDYSYQLHEADLVAFIEALRAWPVQLVGNSYGGAVVLLVALHHPELVRSAAVSEPGSLFPHLIEGRSGADEILAERARSWGEMREAARAGRTDLAAELLFDWISGQAGALSRVSEERRRHWLENAPTVGPQLMQPAPPEISCAAISAIQVPLLVLRGERTIPFYVSTNDALLACLPPGNREAVIPMAGHLSYAENPGAYAGALLDFLALDRPATTDAPLLHGDRQRRRRRQPRDASLLRRLPRGLGRRRPPRGAGRRAAAQRAVPIATGSSPAATGGSGRSSSNASCSARTATSTMSSAMMQVIRISEVEIISMFTFAAASVENIRAA